MPADLRRRTSCVFCEETTARSSDAVLPVLRLALDGKPRYAHPHCVAKALQENPDDAEARVCATQFGMRRDLEAAQEASRAPRRAP